MSFTEIFFENPDIYAQTFPAPAVPFLIKVCESAEAPDMQAKVAKALAEVTALNVQILAAFPDSPEAQLTLADVMLAGAGDGHTFVTTLIFVPADLNGVAPLLSLTGLEMAPNLFSFFFGLAAEQDALAQTMSSTILAATGPEDIVTLFEVLGGGAKGQRFMYGIGGFVEEGGGGARLAALRGARSAPAAK
jgi:hypothetical protein